MRTKPMMNQEPEITLYKPEIRHLLEARVTLLHLSVVCFENKKDMVEAAETIAAVLEKFGPQKEKGSAETAAPAAKRSGPK